MKARIVWTATWVVTVAAVAAVAILAIREERSDPPIGDRAKTSADAAIIPPAPGDSPSAAAIDSVPFVQAPKVDPSAGGASAVAPAQPLVSLEQLSESARNRIRMRIAGSSLMTGIERELQLEALTLTVAQWEEIHRAITDANWVCSPLKFRVRDLLDPMLTSLIDEGRAERVDPTKKHRVRTDSGFAVRVIRANSSQLGVASTASYELRYNLGTNAELDEQLAPIELEFSRQSNELRDRIRSIIQR